MRRPCRRIGARPPRTRIPCVVWRSRVLPSRVALAIGGGLAYFVDRGRLGQCRGGHASAGTESGLSVAVLLFTNQSGDAAQDYFSDGLTEDITRALGRFKELTVSPTAPCCRSANKELPLAEIGRALNARYLVSGSVRRMGQRVRVTVQLSDATNGTQLWSEQYDDELSDIFAVQERIARRVAGTLAIEPAADRPAAEPAQADRQSRRLRHAAARPRAQRRSDARRQPHGARDAGAGDADGAELRRRLCRAGRHLFPARDLRLVGVRPAGRRDGDPARAEGARDRRGLRARPQRAGARLHRRSRSTTSAWPNPSARCSSIPATPRSCWRARPCCCGPAASTNRSPPPRPPCASTSASARKPALNLGLAYLLSPPLRRRGAAARGAARALSDLSAARLAAGRGLCRARPQRRCRRMRVEQGQAQESRTSTSQASARASRTRRCSAGSRKACARRG